jgi:hypothetical protein
VLGGADMRYHVMNITTQEPIAEMEDYNAARELADRVAYEKEYKQEIGVIESLIVYKTQIKA